MVKEERPSAEAGQQIRRPMAAGRDTEEIEAQNDWRRRHIAIYRTESDEQIYQRLRCLAEKLGRPPTKADVPGFDYIKSRLGSWPRILEQAGVKPVSRRRWYGLGQGEQARIEKPRLKKEARANNKPR
ncbi:MAG: hypothetical protein BWY65_01622 [Firmicutes bacterium ADurb.Bin373]|nr:MAG: hypothetical protein BWY65_01622 [Firmicutes bacterium ADurb.Bin373]